MSGRAILNLVKVANSAFEHVRKDFITLCGDSHSWFLLYSRCIGSRTNSVAWEADDHPRGPKFAASVRARTTLANYVKDFDGMALPLRVARQLFLGATRAAIIEQVPSSTLKSAAELHTNNSTV